MKYKEEGKEKEKEVNFSKIIDSVRTSAVHVTFTDFV